MDGKVVPSSPQESILLIEDCLQLRENVAELLGMHGYSVTTAANGEEGVGIATAKQFDLIICDIMMPGISGFDVFKQVKNGSLNECAPFIFLSGVTDQSSQCYGLNIGADDYLFKPLDEKLMISIIRNKIKRSKLVSSDKRCQVEQLERIMQHLSHEVRGPLTTCLGLARLLEEGASFSLTREEFRRIISGISEKVSELEGLTKELTGIVHRSIQEVKFPSDSIVKAG